MNDIEQNSKKDPTLKDIASTRAINIPEFGDYKPSLWYRFKGWFEENNPFGVYLYVGSADEYINAPRKRRTVYWFWYKDVIISSNRALLGTKKDREKAEAFIKKNFPIQYPLRQFGYKMKVRASKIYDAIRYAINPRQRWLTKQIPKDWCDKVSLIPTLNFAMVVHFVDGEDALAETDWDASSEYHSEFAKQLKDCYDYIKNRRPELQKRFENSYPDEETKTGDYHVDYAEHNKIEEMLENEDTKYLVWIVTNRDFFWT